MYQRYPPKVCKSFFAQNFFDEEDALDDDGKGKVDPDKVVDTLAKFNHGDNEERLRFMFNVYDVNGDGVIDPEEMQTILKACMAESRLRLSDDAIEKLALALFQEAGVAANGEMHFEEMKAVLEKFPDILDNLTLSASHLLKQQDTKPESAKPAGCCACPKSSPCSTLYIQNNINSFVCIIVYIVVNIALFSTCVRYRHTNWCVIIARGCGMCLNFNSALLLVFVLRYTLSWLRNTKVAEYLPLDNNIEFHKAVGLLVLVYSLIHTAAHLGNIAIVKSTPIPENSTETELAWWEYLFTLRSGVGYVGPGFGYLSGVILLVILIIMVICAMPCIRRKQFFQVFYWTHLMYVLFYIFLILHGPIFYFFFLIPAVVFLVEKIGITFILSKAKYGQMYIERVNLLPSKVTNLIIPRPPNFRYHAGDWIFIKIPAIARTEWHPFTISSAPENRDELTLHVRSVGSWTNRLYDYFDTYEKDDGGEGGSYEPGRGTYHANRAYTPDEPADQRAGDTQGHTKRRNVNEKAVDIIQSWQKRHTTKHVHVSCSIDGPFGTPTRDIFDSEHAVLIAAGIGVTPFASILQSIWHRYRALKRTCPNCQHKWYGEAPANGMKLKKVHFIWINRDQRCFEWFVQMLTQLEIEAQSTEDAKFDQFFQMEMYMTTAISTNDIKGLGLQLALNLIHKKYNRDLVTGLRTRAKAGRPNWDEVFATIQQEKTGKVKVFFCGSPALAKVLETQCHKNSFEFAKENF